MSQIRESINFIYLSLNSVLTCCSVFHKKHKLVSSGSHRTMFVHLPLRSFLKASNGLGVVVLVPSVFALGSAPHPSPALHLS